MAENLPIDIHSGKLLDWLLSRRHCNKNWQKDVLQIREKIKHAIQDMPENDRIVKLLQGSYINYFHCVEIVEILKETEKDSKNFLGFYSSQRMKDWQEIQTLYKKENIFLAESAQIFQRLIQYDIPGLKRQITKANSGVEECEKKEKEYLRQSADGKRNYEKELKSVGLKGKAFRQEFLELASDLPALCKSLSNDIVSLNEACQYYKNFGKYINSESKIEIFPLLTFLNEKGVDATSFEWKYGKVPERVEPINFDLLIKADTENTADDDEIDFGDDDDIDFGDEVVIDVIADDSGAVGELVARGEDAMTLVEHPVNQKLIKSELQELLSFLSMRKEDETRETAVDLLIRNIEQRPEDISSVNEDKMTKWIDKINEILLKLNNPQTQHLFKIRSSPQFVEKLVSDLELKQSVESRYKKMAELMAEKQAEQRQVIRNTNEELKNIMESTRQLQKQLETEIGLKYNGRRVNIMGGISSVSLN